MMMKRKRFLLLRKGKILLLPKRVMRKFLITRLKKPRRRRKSKSLRLNKPQLKFRVMKGERKRRKKRKRLERV
jgi:hypothetical protein